MEKLQKKNYKEAYWYSSPSLERLGVIYATFTRGTICFASSLLHAKSHLCIQPETIKEILPIKSFRFVRQVHGNRVINVDGFHEQERILADGMITTKPLIGLVMAHADCQIATFYDPKKRILANVHAGWRGSVKNIYQKTVQKLVHEYQSHPKDIVVQISPSLGPKYGEFRNYQKELPKKMWKYKKEGLLFNFWEISKDQLIEEGLLEENIEIAEICTYEREKEFFSYRRDRSMKRNITVVAFGNLN